MKLSPKMAIKVIGKRSGMTLEKIGKAMNLGTRQNVFRHIAKGSGMRIDMFQRLVESCGYEIVLKKQGEIYDLGENDIVIDCRLRDVPPGLV